MHNPEFLHFRCTGHITQRRSYKLGGAGILGGWWTKITLGHSLTSWAYLHLTTRIIYLLERGYNGVFCKLGSISRMALLLGWYGIWWGVWDGCFDFLIVSGRLTGRSFRCGVGGSSLAPHDILGFYLL